MILDIIQNSKELFTADFRMERAGASCGSMHLQGSMASIEGRWTLSLAGRSLEVVPGRRAPGAGESRPYDILAEGAALGRVAQRREKLGFLSSIDYVHLTLSGEEYALYSLMFGEQGGKCPIRASGRQVAQIDTDNIIYDNLHNYHLYAETEGAALAAVLFSAYLYVIGPFKPGEKVKTGVSKYFGTTRNKDLLAKYDPDFAGRCQP